MLSFAKNSPTGDFTFYDPWLLRSLGIAADKAHNPGRRYLISLGGDVRYGGTFEISIGVDDWVAKTADSVERIINEAGADGFEMQWEGNTGDAKFVPAASKLLAELKARGYITVIGPYYGGTSRDYARLPLDNVDFINMQMFAMNIQDESSLAQHTRAAIEQYPSDRRAEARRKMVFGLNSNHRHPSPPVGLEVLKDLTAEGEGVAGVFTWDAEHSAKTMSPPWCLEKLGAEILRGGSPAMTCSW